MGETQIVPPPLEDVEVSPKLERKLSHRLDRWGICFEGPGGNKSIEDFIRHFESLSNIHGAQWDQLHTDFHILLRGQVLDWYLDFLNVEPRCSWSRLKTALLEAFGTFTTDADLLMELMTQRQRDNESISSYFTRVKKMQQAMTRPMSEKEFICLIYRSVRRDIARQLDIAHMNTIGEVRQRCLMVEHLESSQIYAQPRSSSSRKVEELRQRTEEEPESRSIEALQLRGSGPMEPNHQQRSWRCWNCQQLGHGFFDCAEPIKRRFCFSCGQKDVLKPQCPRCSPGNRARERTMGSSPAST